MKRQTMLYLHEETAAQIKELSAKFKVSGSILVEALLGHAFATADCAQVLSEHTGRDADLGVGEERILKAMQRLFESESPVMRFRLQAIATAAAMPTREAFGILTRLLATGRVLKWDISHAHPDDPPEDRWGRPTWWMYYTPEHEATHRERQKALIGTP